MAPAAPGATATIPPQCAGLLASDWVGILPKDFSFSDGPVSLVSDSAAAAGYAAEVPANAGWNADYYVPASQAGTWHCYASMKCSSIDNSGTACDVGIVNNNTVTWNWDAANLPGAANGQYQIYDLGIQELTNVDEFFVAAGTTYDTMVYVDRYYLVDLAQPNSVSNLLGLPDNRDIQLASPLVATTPPGAFSDGSMYIEDANRTAGVRCLFNSGVQKPKLWDNVTFIGAMATDSAGQRYVNVYSMTGDSAGASIGALGTGVESINYGQPSMSGLLVKAWGEVTYVDSSGTFFYIDDGSGVVDSSGVAKGLRVTTAETAPALGAYVALTGIATMSLVPAGSSTAVVPNLRIPNPGATILINSGAAYCASTSVTLTLDAMDTSNQVYEMRFSNDDSTWSSWTAYSTTSSWTLASGDGTKRACGAARSA